VAYILKHDVNSITFVEPEKVEITTQKIFDLKVKIREHVSLLISVSAEML
jgi:hypothetical protein